MSALLEQVVEDLRSLSREEIAEMAEWFKERRRSRCKRR
jgi:hypothetical protein